jgi:hypothetical protein
MPTALQKMNIEEWIGALRSGTYEQTTHALHRGQAFCALGVLADIQGVDWEETRKVHSEAWGLAALYGFEHALTFDVWDGTIPADLWETWTGLGGGLIADISELNDEGATFDEVADSIKEALQ